MAGVRKRNMNCIVQMCNMKDEQKHATLTNTQERKTVDTGQCCAE